MTHLGNTGFSPNRKSGTQRGKWITQDHTASQPQSQGFSSIPRFPLRSLPLPWGPWNTLYFPPELSACQALGAPTKAPLVKGPFPAPSTFPDKDLPVFAMVQDEAVLWLQGPLGEGVLISHQQHWHGARTIGDLRGQEKSPDVSNFHHLSLPRGHPKPTQVHIPTPATNTGPSNAWACILRLWGSLRSSFSFPALSRPCLCPHTGGTWKGQGNKMQAA